MTKRQPALRVPLARMLQVGRSLSLDASHATLGSQIEILTHQRLAFSAHLASTQRQGTVAPASVVQVVASHQLLAAQR